MESSRLYEHAKNELDLAGMFDSQEDAVLAEHIMQLIDLFSDFGHSGSTGDYVVEVFSLLTNWRPLTSLTNDPNEWLKIEYPRPELVSELWQSKRQSNAFSHDGGETFYIVDEPETIYISDEA